MKKNILINLFSIIIIICVASCQNDDAPMQQENNPNDTITNPGNDTVASPVDSVAVPLDSIKLPDIITITTYSSSGQHTGSLKFDYNEELLLSKMAPPGSIFGLSFYYNSGKPDIGHFRLNWVTSNVRQFVVDGDVVSQLNFYESQSSPNNFTGLRFQYNFSYDTNNRVTSFVLADSINQENSGTGNYNYDGLGNVITYGFQAEGSTENIITEYLYDTASNPFKNMPSFTTVMFTREFFVKDITSIVNNVTQSIVYDADGNVTEQITYTYEYDADNFPVKRTATSNGVVTEVVEYEYTYGYIYE